MFLPRGWNKNEKFENKGKKMTKKEGEKMWEGKDLRKKGVKEKKGEQGSKRQAEMVKGVGKLKCGEIGQCVVYGFGEK